VISLGARFIVEMMPVDMEPNIRVQKNVLWLLLRIAGIVVVGIVN
jgi:hypothetical protein